MSDGGERGALALGSSSRCLVLACAPVPFFHTPLFGGFNYYSFITCGHICLVELDTRVRCASYLLQDMSRFVGEWRQTLIRTINIPLWKTATWFDPFVFCFWHFAGTRWSINPSDPCVNRACFHCTMQPEAGFYYTLCVVSVEEIVSCRRFVVGCATTHVPPIPSVLSSADSGRYHRRSVSAVDHHGYK